MIYWDLSSFLTSADALIVNYYYYIAYLILFYMYIVRIHVGLLESISY